MEVWLGMIESLGSIAMLLFAGFAFYMLRYVPSRKEFEMHLRDDDSRFAAVLKKGDEIQDAMRDMKEDLIREFKNGKHY